MNTGDVIFTVVFPIFALMVVLGVFIVHEMKDHD
jgi:hypothetical protein